jgi:ParB-like chromosome segregation protein Spo0J
MQKIVSAAPRWAPDKIEQWPVDRLLPAKRNARTHSAEQIEQLRLAMRKFGFPKPILVRHTRRIIAGHGRWEAAKLEGFKTVPVIIAPRAWTDAECRAYAIADNQLGLNSDWDAQLLTLELGELAELSVEPADLGFDDKQLVELGNLFASSETGQGLDAAPQLGGLTYQVILVCRDEQHQRALLARFEKEGLTCRALIS